MYKLAALHKSVKVTHPGDDRGQLEGIHINSAISAVSVRATIDDAYGVIEKQLLESIPWPNNSKFRKIQYAWPVCTRRVSCRPLKDIMKKRGTENTSSEN